MIRFDLNSTPREFPALPADSGDGRDGFYRRLAEFGVPSDAVLAYRCRDGLAAAGLFTNDADLNSPVAVITDGEPTPIAFDAAGRPDLDRLFRTGKPPQLAIVPFADGFTGVMLPFADIARRLRNANDECLIIGDASFGFSRTAAEAADALIFTGRFAGDPSTITAVCPRRGRISLSPASAERVDVAGIPFTSAVFAESASSLKTELTELLTAAVPDAEPLFPDAARSANTACISFAGINSETAAARLAERGFAVGSASKCRLRPRPVSLLEAADISYRTVMGTISFGAAENTPQADIEALASALSDVVGCLRVLSGYVRQADRLMP